jgi:RimJ/RimL family protein N-acetyltransferase
MEPVERRALVTGRLRLEPVGPEHTESMWRATEASLDQLTPWLSWTKGASRDTTAWFAEYAVAEWHEGREFDFAILEEGAVVGTIGLRRNHPVTPNAELGYWCRTDRAGRGLVSEAGAAMVNFGFDVLGLHRITLMAGLENRASQRVAEKLGFRREGSLRQVAWSATDPYDCFIYGLIATDPRPGDSVG